jgi:hypothetical protein
MVSGLGIQILDTYFVGMRAAGKSSRDTKESRLFKMYAGS